MYIAYTPGSNILCSFWSTYEEAFRIANEYWEDLGIVVTVEQVAQHPLPKDSWWVMLPLSSGIDPMKDIRIRVETYDGCCTIWYERSKLKNPTEVICNRVTNQLMGLNIKEVNVSVIWLCVVLLLSIHGKTSWMMRPR